MVLTTRYSQAVLAGNPDINALYSYAKGKHRSRGESLLSLYWQRLLTVLELRGHRFDWVLLPGGAHKSALRFSRWIGGHRVLVRGPGDTAAGPHEVEQTCHLLTRMGLDYDAPPARVVAPAAQAAAARRLLAAARAKTTGPVIGLHISARKPSQRWPADRFCEIARMLHERHDAALMLLWAPGGQNDPLHPGDDEKAARITADAGALPITAVSTVRLEELIGAISVCDHFICGDGGAMHIAAGLGKPIVAMFGQSSVEHWRPWGVPQVVLQKPSLDVADIAPDEVMRAFDTLLGQTEAGKMKSAWRSAS